MDRSIELPLTKGYTAIVSAEDVRVANRKWQAHVVRRSRTIYASTQTTDEEHEAGWPRRMLLHRFIMGDPHGPDIDHIDGNGLNCTRGNLRIASNSLNNRNVSARGSCQRVGVVFDRSNGKWRATGKINGRQYTIGRFDTEEGAIAARALWEAEHFPGVVFRWSVDHAN